MIIFNYLLLLTISYVIAITRKTINFNTLYCGLIGYCGSVKPDTNSLKILAIYNDTRGGDSCGIYTNDNVSYGINKLSKFTDYFINEPFPELGKEDFSCIMHTRRASSGFIKSSDNAHPFLLKNAEGNPGFVGAHNGTLRNWMKLCRDRDISLANIDVDSHGLLACIYKDNSFKVLSEYDGGAALLFKDVTKVNQLYAFKGGGGGYEERPLYYYQKVNTRGKVTGVYISSLEDSLRVIGAEKNQVIEFKNNELISFKDGYVESSTIIARSVDLNTAAPVSHWKKEENYDDNFYGASSRRLDFKKQHNAKVGKIYNNTLKPRNLFVEEGNDPFYKGNTVCFQKFRFFRNGVLLHGGAIINRITKKASNYSISFEEDMDKAWNLKKDNTNNIKLWFVNGVSFKSFEDFIKAADRCKELSKTNQTCYAGFMNDFKPSHPVLTITKLKGRKKKSFSAVNSIYYGDKTNEDYEYSNDFSPFIYKIKNGVLIDLLNKKEELKKRSKPNILDAYDNVNEFDDIDDLEDFGNKVATYYEEAVALLRNFFEIREDEDISYIYKKIFEFVFNIYTRDIVLPDDDDLEFFITLEDTYKLNNANVKK